MIGVIASDVELGAVEEFFQLFKTPWEPYQEGRRYEVVIASVREIPVVEARLLIVFGSCPTSLDAALGVRPGTTRRGAMLDSAEGTLPTYGDSISLVAADARHCVGGPDGSVGLIWREPHRTLMRVGYDLFREIDYLLTTGQPVERAGRPAADLHAALLRGWMLDAGSAFVEIPPVPAGKLFSVCLTHDIDFVGIRRHMFDRTMWGFLYRATVGSVLRFAGGRLSLRSLLGNLMAVARLPFVYLGLAKDFWEPFEWYIEAEDGVAATYFLIPFKGRAGERLEIEHGERRACAYDLRDVADAMVRLQQRGHEIGVHGLDAWHSADRGRVELQRIQQISRRSDMGIRMHWLLGDDRSPRVLEEAGFVYDSSAGYNETVGYRNGTAQVFRPPGCAVLLELPLHIQDGAMFLPNRLDLSESKASYVCSEFIRNAERFGGVLTLLWHDRSHAPERHWGAFYLRLLRELRSMNVWFGSAAQVVRWFRNRRAVTFERTGDGGARLSTEPLDFGMTMSPPLAVRVHRRPDGVAEGQSQLSHVISWDGVSCLELPSIQDWPAR